MKRIESILIEIVIFSLLFISCEKDQSSSEKKDDVQPSGKLMVTVSPDSVAYKGTSTVSWNSENLKSLNINGQHQSDIPVYINGVRYPDKTLGTIVLYSLVKDTTFNFNGEGLDGKTLSNIKKIKVGPKP